MTRIQQWVLPLGRKYDRPSAGDWQMPLTGESKRFVEPGPEFLHSITPSRYSCLRGSRLQTKFACRTWSEVPSAFGTCLSILQPSWLPRRVSLSTKSVALGYLVRYISDISYCGYDPLMVAAATDEVDGGGRASHDGRVPGHVRDQLLHRPISDNPPT